MTTREVYYKVYASSEMPVAIFYYVFKDKNDTIQLFGSRNISFRDDHENNIKQLEKVEKTDGFMFWNQSTEGEKFFNSNAMVIGKALANMVLNQK